MYRPNPNAAVFNPRGQATMRPSNGSAQNSGIPMATPHPYYPHGHAGAPQPFNATTIIPYAQFVQPPPQMQLQVNSQVGVQIPSGARPAHASVSNYNSFPGVSPLMAQNGATPAMIAQHHPAGNTVSMTQQIGPATNLIPTTSVSATVDPAPRESKAIDIIDPETGKNIMEEVNADTGRGKSPSGSWKEEKLSSSNLESSSASSTSGIGTSSSSDKKEDVKQQFVDMVYNAAREPADKMQSTTASSDVGNMKSDSSNDDNSTSNSSRNTENRLEIHTDKNSSDSNLPGQAPGLQAASISEGKVEESNSNSTFEDDGKSKSTDIDKKESEPPQEVEDNRKEEESIARDHLPTVSDLESNNTFSQNASKELDKETVDVKPIAQPSSESPTMPNNVPGFEQNEGKSTEAEASSNKTESMMKYDNTSVNSEEQNSDNRQPERPNKEDSTTPTLKYAYEKDQWSPINLSGRKQYGREFLMQLQTAPLSLKKPSNLQGVDIVRNAMNERHSGGLHMNQKGSYVMSSNSRGGGITKRGSASGRKPDGTPRNKIVIQGLSIQEKVELHTSDMAWRPGKLAASDGDSDDLMELKKKARAILNKLTPQKFDILVTKFSELQIDTEEKLKVCMELVFEKAVDEPGFSVAYAKMCEILSKKETTRKETADGPQQQQGTLGFRKLLITRCQKEFERDYMQDVDSKGFEKRLQEETSEEKKKDIQAELEEEERKARRRSNGNIRFIGELFKLNMLTVRIMHECCYKLIYRKDEESLECLCKLLNTVGKELEAQSEQTIKALTGKSGMDKKDADIFKVCSEFPAFFDKVQGIINSKTTSSRIRFLLQDLIDLRKNRWVPRREVVGPTTIDKIHKDAHDEKARQHLENLVPKTPMGGGGGSMGRDRNKRPLRGPMNSGGPMGLPNQQTEDGWSTVGGNRSRSSVNSFDRSNVNSFDFSKIRNDVQRMKNQDADNMQLGPGSKASWAKGSMTGARLSQTREDSAVSNQKNRYATLSPTTDGPEFDSTKLAGSRSIGVPGRGSRGQSTENDRRKPFQASRDFNGSNNSARRGGPTTSLPPPTSKKPLSPDQGKLLKGEPNLNEEDISTRSKPLIAEFLNVGNEDEAIACISEQFHPSTISAFVKNAFDAVIELKTRDREQTGNLMKRLVKNGMLTRNQYEEGLLYILELAPDLVIDIPTLWDCLGEVIAPMLVEEILPFNIILDTVDKGFTEKNSRAEFAGKYVASILHKLVAQRNSSFVASLWQKAGLNWEKFVPAERVSDFIASNNLQFTEEIGMEEIARNLKKLLRNHSSDDDIFKWIEKNVGQQVESHSFIRILTETVIDSAISGAGGGQCEIEEHTLGDRVHILKRYLDANVEKEKQALFALQHLMHKLEHPNKMLSFIFQKLFEMDGVTEEGFQAWKKCNNPADLEGKGVAITSTTQFFTWLEEAEEEEEEEDNSADVKGEEEAAAATPMARTQEWVEKSFKVKNANDKTN